MGGGVTWVWLVAGGVLVALLLAQAVVVLGVLQRATALLEAVEAHLGAASGAPGGSGPAVGTPLPELAIEDAQGAPVAMAELQGTTGPPLVLLLLAPDCPHCQRLLDRLRAVSEAPTVARVVAITDVAVRLDLTAAPPPSWVTVCYERDGAVARALGAAYVPMAVAVAGDGRITAVEVPKTADDLARLGQLAGAPLAPMDQAAAVGPQA